MSNLSWITPPGLFASVVINNPVDINMLAYSNGATVTYSIIGGSLPPGLTLHSNGNITGTPVYESVEDNYFSTREYSFIARAVDASNSVSDRAFSISVANSINGNFTWVTPSGNLGTVPDGSFYSFQLEIVELNGNPVTFSFISGELPPGMQISKSGSLVGVPVLLTSTVVNESQTFSFSVRATNSLGHINDRSFSLTVTNVYGPVIEPSAPGKKFLGTYFDGTFFTQQLSVIELNPNVQIDWTVTNGQLPTGVTLGSNGLLSGYIQPLQIVGDFGPAGFDGDSEVDGVITQRQEYDAYGTTPYDFNQLNQNLTYNFTVQAYDGANYDIQEYTLGVSSRSGFTADSTATIDNSYLTIDSLNVYPPVLLNSSTVLATARQNSYYAFKFEGQDFQGDEITYNVANTSGTFDCYVSGIDEGFDYGPFDSFDDANTAGAAPNLPGLTLDASTGWLYGKLNAQSSSYQVYTFGVQVRKVRNNVTYSSTPIYFSLPVLGDVNNLIEWVSTPNLGTINNGSISELAVVAKSLAGRTDLVYTLYDNAGVPIRLPQGLTLLPTGEISGRVTFEASTIDNYATTFDGNRLTLDRDYHFTVQVQTSDGTASAMQEFTVTVNIIDNKPYENLYLKAMTALDQRQIYQSVITNTDIFSPELIYRPDDPWFGISRDINMLFAAGLTPADLDAYHNAILRNHWTKTYSFGAIKSAVVLNEYYQVKYEVVYIDIIDPAESSLGTGPGLTLDLTNVIANPYIDSAGDEFKIVYPNTSDNMLARLENSIGYADQSSLPEWMTSNQPDSTSANKFKTPLGFVKASVIAYTKPGASKLIAYRLQNSGINFNNIQFTVDRYLIDNYYSTNFDTATQTYRSGREATFDYLPNTNVGTIVATVNYGVTVPFSEINGRPVSYINSQGGIDGDTTFKDGETLIFVRQENFTNGGPYDGWAAYTDAWIGDNTLTVGIEGYGSGSYDTYTIITGYLEKTQGTIYVSATGNPSGGTNTWDPYDYELTIDNINGLSVGQSISFAGAILGGIETTKYYIRSIRSAVNTSAPIIIDGITQYATNYYISLSQDSNLASLTLLTPATGSYQGMAGYTIANNRGGIWQINIVNNIVNLTPIAEIEVNQRVRVFNGQTYSGAILYYNNTLTPGQTVPFYQVYKYTPDLERKRTTFNGDTTRFFSLRDQYYAPESQDKYVKFPQYGVFS